MATDHSILEDELTHQLSDLKRNLHMRGVRSLDDKHGKLAKMSIQRKQINQMSKEVEKLEPTISRMYSSQHALEDKQIKGYLIYLLKLKEFFSREVKTKKEIIQQREDQIKKLVIKLCAMRTEYAKKNRSRRRKAPEFTLLENMSNRMNQIEKRVCALQLQNKEIRESIMDMRIFERQYKKFEKKFRKRIKQTTEEVQTHLDGAVAAYEEREEFVNKGKVYQERCTQDWRKAAINENSLNLVLAKTKKYEDFENLQNQDRFDSRIALTEDLIKEGRTGLEPTMEKADVLHTAIVFAAGKDNPEDIEDQFNLTDDDTNSKFSYLEELLKEIHHTQITVHELQSKNKELLGSLSTKERRLRWEIEETQMGASISAGETEAAVQLRDQARDELDILQTAVRSLYQKCRREYPSESSEETPEERIEGTGKDEEGEPPEAVDTAKEDIDDSNAIDFNENIENKILEYLMLIEYLRMKESADEEPTSTVAGADEYVPVLDEHVDLAGTGQPHSFQNGEDLKSVSRLDEEKRSLSLGDLTEKEVASTEESEPAVSTRSESSTFNSE